jgi:thiamine pyrophosphate-dependent acetolactate synthase large subunit-like protein
MVEPEKMSIARLQIGKHVPATSNIQANVKEHLEAVFSMARGLESETRNECAGKGQQPFTRKRNRTNVESRGGRKT